MSDDVREPGRPAETGIEELPRTLPPPSELEDRVVRALEDRGLIRSAAGGRGRSLRPGLAAAAALALLTLGFVLGRAIAPSPSPVAVAQRPGYALLLYETQGYDRAVGPEALERYREYSVWVAEARRRGQFVTGEDFAVDDGWVMTLTAGEPRVEPGVAPAAAAPLSGVFLIRASDAGEALALAESLPHLRHGGSVVVQEVIPTETPPSPESE